MAWSDAFGIWLGLLWFSAASLGLHSDRQCLVYEKLSPNWLDVVRVWYDSTRLQPFGARLSKTWLATVLAVIYLIRFHFVHLWNGEVMQFSLDPGLPSHGFVFVYSWLLLLRPFAVGLWPVTFRSSFVCVGHAPFGITIFLANLYVVGQRSVALWLFRTSYSASYS